MKVYSPEFRADAVALYLSDPTRTYASVAKDLGAGRETLRLWVRSARAEQASQVADTSNGTAEGHRSRHSAPAPVSSAPVLEAENRQLRARIRELETERDILRRAAKYFAGETSW